ncbi:hypothetical protein HHL21_01995 [Massilia sp. RP-1-19]|uniref:Uncharacterized protein n=1 Tax=Massilia polaris TaxID=2728846 RepID=A0A848HFX6_9BURK|nr:hypothetical protein [Massilia polaris]NML59872.1 hypothetical protein [Massilia polaris]
MTTSTLHFVSENAALSSLAASISTFFKPAQGVRAPGEPGLMDLYRLAASGDSVSPAVAAALSKRAAN